MGAEAHSSADQALGKELVEGKALGWAGEHHSCWLVEGEG